MFGLHIVHFVYSASETKISGESSDCGTQHKECATQPRNIADSPHRRQHIQIQFNNIFAGPLWLSPCRADAPRFRRVAERIKSKMLDSVPRRLASLTLVNVWKVFQPSGCADRAARAAERLDNRHDIAWGHIAHDCRLCGKSFVRHADL